MCTERDDVWCMCGGVMVCKGDVCKGGSMCVKRCVVGGGKCA